MQFAEPATPCAECTPSPKPGHAALQCVPRKLPLPQKLPAVRLSGACDNLLYATPSVAAPGPALTKNPQKGRPMKTSQPAAALILISGPAMSGDDPKVAEEIMALARAQWAAEAAGRAPPSSPPATADDYTEFNPDFPARIEANPSPTDSPRPSARTVPGRSWEKWRIRRCRSTATPRSFRTTSSRAQQGQGRQDHAEQRSRAASISR